MFKRRPIQRDDVVAYRCRLLAREACQVRSALMRLEQMESTHLEQQGQLQNLVSALNIDNLRNVAPELYNIMPLLSI